MESLAFDTLTFDHPAACRPARLTASLHLPEADRAGALHGDPDQQRGRPAPSRALLCPGAERGRRRRPDRRQLHRPRRAPHRRRPDPGLGRPDGGRRLCSAGPAARRPAHRSRADRHHGRLQGRRCVPQRRHRRAPALARGLPAPVRPACRDLPRGDRAAPRSDDPRQADLLHAGGARRLHAGAARRRVRRAHAGGRQRAHQGQGLRQRPSRLGIGRPGVRHQGRRELVVLHELHRG